MAPLVSLSWRDVDNYLLKFGLAWVSWRFVVGVFWNFMDSLFRTKWCTGLMRFGMGRSKLNGTLLLSCTSCFNCRPVWLALFVRRADGLSWITLQAWHRSSSNFHIFVKASDLWSRRCWKQEVWLPKLAPPDHVANIWCAMWGVWLCLCGKSFMKWWSFGLVRSCISPYEVVVPLWNSLWFDNVWSDRAALFQPIGAERQSVKKNIFYLQPYLGKIPILTNIFQRCWNHQPVIINGVRETLQIVKNERVAREEKCKEEIPCVTKSW